MPIYKEHAARRWRHLLMTSLVLALAGCTTSGTAPRKPASPAAGPAGFFGAPAAAQPVPQTAPEAAGRSIYDGLCASCHGLDGRGATPLALELTPRPQDLTRCNFKHRSTPSGSLPTDRDLLRTLYVGLPGSAMPAFAALVPLPELRAAVKEVKRRCDRYLTGEAVGAPLAPGRWQRYEEASAARGRAVYTREGCNSCHGDAGRGNGPAAGPLRDAAGRPIQPRDYTAGVYRSGFSRADIYRAFSTGLDGTPMPALPAAVSEQDRWDLTHYLVSLSARRSALLRAATQAPSWYEPARTRGLKWR